jgi:transcriptional regulator with XRE-family HTH domain
MVIGNRLKELRESKELSQGGSTGGEAVYPSKLRKLLAKMKPNDQKFLLHMAQKAARG